MKSPRTCVQLIVLMQIWLAWTAGPLAASTCSTPTATTLRLRDRFEVGVNLPTNQGTVLGHAVCLTPTAGAFWFYSPDRLELAIKILDGTIVNKHFQVLYGGLSRLEYEIKVKDIETGISKTYLHPEGDPSSGSDSTTFSSSSFSPQALPLSRTRSALPAKAEDLVADFSFKILGSSVRFTDESKGNPDRWCWTFGDQGSGCDSEEQNPQHEYATGKYRVHLLVSRTDGPALTLAEKEIPIAIGPSPCSFSLSPLKQKIDAEGGSRNVKVRASASNCTWTAMSNDDFLTITEFTGVGDGVVKYSVKANPSSSKRDGTLTIAGLTFPVTQDGLVGVECTYRFEPPQQEHPLPAGASTGNKVHINASDGCPWTATVASGQDFLEITSSPTGRGPGDVEYKAAANPNHKARAGSLKVADQTFVVNQEAAPCIYTIDPISMDFSAAGGAGTISVTAPGGCEWTAESQADFAKVDSDTTSGSGMGVVSYTVEPNHMAAKRSGSLLIAGKTFTVNQSGCDADLDPNQKDFSADGGTGTIGVSASADCTWEALSNSPFLHITSGAGGSGNGMISYSVDQNPFSLGRRGALTVGDREFLVLQSGCAEIDPNMANFLSAGGSGTVNVTAPSDCKWIAESNVDFITLTSGMTGSGNDMIGFQVGPTGPQRAGTLSIAGNTFTVKQEGSQVEASCIQSNSGPGIAIFEALGGISRLDMKAENDCSWTVETDSTFLKVDEESNSGSGEGKVPFCVAANRHAQRSGFLSVSQSPLQVTSFPISQKAPASGDPAAPCPVNDPGALCLHEGRFEVRATFGDSPSFHAGQAVGVTSSTGFFWFSDKANPELVVKVIDDRPLENTFQVFSGALTDLPYVITVTDTETGRKTFFCNLNSSFQSFTDTESLPSN